MVWCSGIELKNFVRCRKSEFQLVITNCSARRQKPKCAVTKVYEKRVEFSDHKLRCQETKFKGDVR